MPQPPVIQASAHLWSLISTLRALDKALPISHSLPLLSRAHLEYSASPGAGFPSSCHLPLPSPVASFPQLTNISLVQKKVYPPHSAFLFELLLSSFPQWPSLSHFLASCLLVDRRNAVGFPSQPPWCYRHHHCLINCQIAGPVLALIQSFLQDASLLRETLFCLDVSLPFTPCLPMAP